MVTRTTLYHESDAMGGPELDEDGNGTVRIVNDPAENGESVVGPLSWLNSARITADPDDDAIHCVVSVGDPRGGFCFTVRRRDDGQLLIHVPHPGEGMAHEKTEALFPGTLIVCGDFSDDWTDVEDEVRDWDREKCVDAVHAAGSYHEESDSVELLREHVVSFVKDGTLDWEDIR